MNNSAVEELNEQLKSQGYIADPSLLMSIYISEFLNQPLFLEGEPGVGKTEVAKALAKSINGELIRIQCFPGIESNEVLYEWNYLKQIVNIRLREHQLLKSEQTIVDTLQEKDLFHREFLIARPLLSAIQSDKPVVLLIDEIDRSDERFEAFLLEFLSDFQVTIPELGTIEALKKPKVILTSNRSREVHDALRRRCIYQWIDYPSLEKEMEIIKRKTPGLSESLLKQVSSFVSALRKQQLDKKPGLSESLDWARTIAGLELESIWDKETFQQLAGCLLKTKEDHELVTRRIEDVYRETRQILARLS
ncbi:MoxR family ATPase [Peribacillus saganii]|uniref:MoxR family ATPase n=1 Tax=Peribacillus saganii TaxID=2303992 RepID=A0A372LQI8_9BACI|nr:MoxR family ATPase [Peribacillus saganii]RFU70489.1 MoxR family ATPase [Peribacillus saganii]